MRYLRDQGFSRLSVRSVYELRCLLVDNQPKAEVLALARNMMLTREDWQFRAKQARAQYVSDFASAYSVPAGGGGGGAASCLATAAK